MYIEWRKLTDWYTTLLKSRFKLQTTPAILLALKGFLNIIEVQYSKKVKVIKCNNKIITTYPQVYAKIVQ
ncbi:hypothetical protein CEK25_002140 [Fusarium fujikuroi]|nr:hypothetical protein CEK25_002140 [Fusarium fujikuroi]